MDDLLRRRGRRDATPWRNRCPVSLHTRRGFERSKDLEPAASAESLGRLDALYRVEAQIHDRGLSGAAKRDYRQAQAVTPRMAFCP